MAKGSDLRGKLGTGGTSNLPKKADNTFHISDLVKDAIALEKQQKQSVAAQNPDTGHNLHKGTDKSKGGGGSAGGRPKV